MGDNLRMIRVKRVYEPKEAADGARFLVDRLWPRGMSKETLAIEGWVKDAAPSDDLRHWYHHEPAQWDEFRKRYSRELEANRDAWLPLLEMSRGQTVTLLYASKAHEQNNAVALKEFLTEKLHEKAH